MFTRLPLATGMFTRLPLATGMFTRFPHIYLVRVFFPTREVIALLVWRHCKYLTHGFLL
jgi:hypothetical protein